MTITQIILITIIGIVGGISAGLFGLGGGVIIIPFLVYVMGVDQLTAQGTTLAMMLPPIGLVAAYSYYKQGHVRIDYAIMLAIFFIIGSYFGAKLSFMISLSTLKKIFGIFIVLMGLKMIFSK
ncbi:MAG: sulfite exporter TauE/SafE family protein [Sediminibacterium sp.]|nr:sulfite exporter TauE/SafE family protein [Sediminibacterium sp.]